MLANIFFFFFGKKILSNKKKKKKEVKFIVMITSSALNYISTKFLDYKIDGFRGLVVAFSTVHYFRLQSVGETVTPDGGQTDRKVRNGNNYRENWIGCLTLQRSFNRHLILVSLGLTASAAASKSLSLKNSNESHCLDF